MFAKTFVQSMKGDEADILEMTRNNGIKGTAEIIAETYAEDLASRAA